MKAGLFTFTEEKCGVAEYSKSLAASLSKLIEIKTVPIKRETINHAIKELNECDIAHIQHNYEFWGSNFFSSSVAFIDFLSRISVPVACTLHSVWPPLKPSGIKMKIADALGIYNFYNHKSFDKSCAIIIHTETQKEIMAGRGFKPENIFVIPAGVPDPFPEDKNKTRAFIKKWELEGKKTIGLFGFISRYKRYELALEALAALPEEYVMVFAGESRSADDKAYLPEFMAKVNSLMLSKRIRITGFIPDNEQPEMFSAIELFVVPYSENASISYAINVCLAYSRPTIAADVTLSKKINEKYGCIELFKAGDISNLRDKILSLSRDSARRAKLSANCGRFHGERNWDAAAEETLKVYNYCIDKWKKKNA